MKNFLTGVLGVEFRVVTVFAGETESELMEERHYGDVWPKRL